MRPVGYWIIKTPIRDQSVFIKMLSDKLSETIQVKVLDKDRWTDKIAAFDVLNWSTPAINSCSLYTHAIVFFALPF